LRAESRVPSRFPMLSAILVGDSPLESSGSRLYASECAAGYGLGRTLCLKTFAVVTRSRHSLSNHRRARIGTQFAVLPPGSPRITARPPPGALSPLKTPKRYLGTMLGEIVRQYALGTP